MQLTAYRRISNVLPFSTLRVKMFAAAFCATHIPLLALVTYLILHQGEVSAVQSFVLVLAATLAGTAMVLWALNALLTPTRMALRALTAYNESRVVLPLPTDLKDDMGELLRGIRSTLTAVDERRVLVQRAVEPTPAPANGVSGKVTPLVAARAA